MIPTKLDDLYTTGTTMKEADPLAIGLPLKLWRKLDIERQCNEYLRTKDPKDAPLSKKAVATPRDNYGIKGYR